jgi:phenylalanyl-tRNA synthetase beta chain
VFRPRPGDALAAPILPVDRGPTGAELASLDAALPGQPLRIGAVLAGDIERAGWWGRGRAAGWQDAIEAARLVLRACQVPFEVAADQHPPWHPGRCAALYLTGPGGERRLAGHAGELHPRVVQAFRLPERTCAMELDLTEVEDLAVTLPPAQAPRLPAYPVATLDVALVVADSVPAAAVKAALADGAASRPGGEGSLLEEVRLFDVYTGAQVGEGNKSLAYTLRFRAPDRTLTDEETLAARDAAVAEAARRTGAVLRGGA